MSLKTDLNINPVRERVFKVVAILLPFLLLALLEIGLRLFDYGPELGVFKPYPQDPKYLEVNQSVGKRYFFVSEFTPGIAHDVILKHKPENGLRIFVLGGSTTAGFPYYFNGAFPRMLAAGLESAFHDKYIEIVNFGMAAVSSYTVLDLIDELVDYEPDLFLIYAGHNEFYGALGIGSTEGLGQNREFINLYLGFQHFKVFLLLRDFIGWLQRTAMQRDEEVTKGDATMMERMVSNKLIPADDPDYLKASRNFQKNLEEMFTVAREHNTKLIISNLVSNIRDQVPFESIYREDIDRNLWDENLFTAKEVLAAGDSNAALENLAVCESIDPDPAVLSYYMAKSQEVARRYDGAKSRYYRAKDLDALRFRASEDFNEIIRETSIRFNIPMIDMKGHFEAESSHGLIGSNLMLDHLHPNLDGYFLMAKAFFNEIVNQNQISSGRDAPVLSNHFRYQDVVYVTPLDIESANMSIDSLTSGWPFKRGGRPSFAKNYKPQNKVEKLALELYTNEKNWENVHLELAEYYEDRQAYNEAAMEYRALLRATPYNISPYLRLARVYLKSGKNNEALDVLMKSLPVQETAIANKWIADIYIQRASHEQALPYIEREYAISTNDTDILIRLVVMLASLNKDDELQPHCSILLQERPHHPKVEELCH